MKALRTITALTLLIFSFSSCDKAKDILQADFEFSLDETMSVNSTSTDDVTYSDSRTINPSDDGNIDDNLDNIKDYTVEKVTITVSNLVTDGSPSVSNLILTLTHSTGTITMTSAQALDLAALQAAGATDLDVGADILQNIKSMLVAGGDITLGASATVEDGPAAFDLTISIDGKITVGV